MEVPLESVLSLARCAQMPCCAKVRSNRSANPSAPTLPRKATRAPRDAAAKALLAPPPPMVSTMDETEVSPSQNKCSPGCNGAVFRSRLILPTTDNELPSQVCSSLNMRGRLLASGQDILHHMPVHVREAELAALVGIDHAFVVKAQTMKKGGLKVVH